MASLTKFAALGAIAALAVVMAPQSSRASVLGTIDINGPSYSGSAATAANYDLSTATTIQFGSTTSFITLSGGSGNLSDIAPATLYTVTAGGSSPTFSINIGSNSQGPITPVAMSPIVITATGTDSDVFTFTFTQSEFGGRHAVGSSGSSLTEYLIGTLSDSLGNIAANETASATLALTQTGGVGTTVSLSGTLADPSGAPVGTPEPATIALLATGLFGLGFLRRRA